jgi:transposase-like protein
MFLTHCNVLRADLLKEGRIRTQQKRPICPICPSYMLKGNDYHPAPIPAPKSMKRAPIGTRHMSGYVLNKQTKEQHPPRASQRHACPKCDSAFH